mmetsp:Transcript_33700/g.66886  ORF Transcript_33700/g.66886 Transcript_33700/m.66886 type:complete len:125 (+) Transcript_33700:61-435(+)
MGAAASIDADVFNAVKAEYEAKKAEGVSDEQLFESMKSFLEAKSGVTSAGEASKVEEATTAPTVVAAEAEAPAAAAAASAQEAKPVEDGGEGVKEVEATAVTSSEGEAPVPADAAPVEAEVAAA